VFVPGGERERKREKMNNKMKPIMNENKKTETKENRISLS
jgi:hypothetical protein